MKLFNKMNIVIVYFLSFLTKNRFLKKLLVKVSRLKIVKKIFYLLKPEMSPTFCVYPWMEFLLGPTSYFRLCCIAETVVEDKDGRAYNSKEDLLDDYWNSYGLRQVRKKMLAGKRIKACNHCYYQESIGQTSYRQTFNRQWLYSESGKDILDRVKQSRTNGFRVEKPPLYLDIRPGNLCNLKCRMCNPGNSSKIYQEQKQLLKNHPSEMASLINIEYFDQDEKKFHNWYKNPKIWENIYKWIPNIKRLYFTGGEPTLIKENWKMITYLKQKGYSKNIHLTFNINCTQAPDKLLETFQAFETVSLNFSVDGYKSVGEYIRHPSKWENIESNVVKILKQRKENTYFYFTPVIQVYNILSLPQLFKWIDELRGSYGAIKNILLMCTDPDFLDIAILPRNIKQKALLKIEEYEGGYKGSDYVFSEGLNAVKNVLKKKEKAGIDKFLRRFYKYTKFLDKERNDNFEKIFPELNQLLDEDGRWKN